MAAAGRERLGGRLLPFSGALHSSLGTSPPNCSPQTALIRRFVKNYFNDTYNPTTESTSDKLFYLEELATMEILEAPPQEEYAPLREQCARACDGLLLVYSVTSRVSFEAALALQAEVVRARREANRFPLVLVGSKRDLGAERRVSESEGRAAAAAMGGCPFYEASARWEAFFIEDAFHSLVRSVRDGKAAKERAGRLGSSTRGRSAKCVLL
ncbi:ras family-domain-containing protein [Zopfochytrium polystomum]|nr:ras family-domain-containing protein [Zopfochytrium polystomum]